MAGKLSRHPSLRQHDDPIGQREQFGEFAGGKNNAEPLPAEAVDEHIEFGLGPHIDSARRIIQQEDLWIG